MMKKVLFAFAPAAALAAGVLLVHCSSSSSSATDAGTDGHKASSSTAKSTNSKADGGTSTTKTTTAAQTTSTTTANTNTTSASSSSTKPFSISQDAAACVPMAGETACTPGKIGCGDGGSCSLFAGDAGAAQMCCHQSEPNDGGTALSCMAQTATCGAAYDGGDYNSQACGNAWDCAPNEICCLYVLSIAPASIAKTACQSVDAGYTCKKSPGVLVPAQICRSDNECQSGSCNMWCCQGNQINSCTDPMSSLCTKMDAGSTCS